MGQDHQEDCKVGTASGMTDAPVLMKKMCR